MAGVPKKGWKETLILLMKARFIGIFIVSIAGLGKPFWSKLQPESARPDAAGSTCDFSTGTPPSGSVNPRAGMSDKWSILYAFYSVSASLL
jgi:hypothetical protein